MRIYYVDAENVGLNTPEAPAPDIIDRVFVFTRSPSQIETCRNTCLSFVTGYPKGPNQADFAIMAHLGMVLGRLTPAEKNAIELVLCSRDKGLWMAFDGQCSRAGVAAINPYIEESGALVQFLPSRLQAASPQDIAQNQSDTDPAPATFTLPPLAQQILALIIEPIKFSELHAQLCVSHSQFLSSFNSLIERGLICRCASAKKKWVRCSKANSQVSRIKRPLDAA